MKDKILSFLNGVFHTIFKKTFKPREHNVLHIDLYEEIKKHGEGEYIIMLKRRKKKIDLKLFSWPWWMDKVGYVISKRSGGLVHIATGIYYKNYNKYFTEEQMAKINQMLKFYYNEDVKLGEEIKIIILNSAEEMGNVCFDFSHYQESGFYLAKVPWELMTDEERIKFLDRNIEELGEPYGITDLISHDLNHILDSKNEGHCAEGTYERFQRIGIKIANNPDPSPLDIKNHIGDWIIYEQ